MHLQTDAFGWRRCLREERSRSDFARAITTRCFVGPATIDGRLAHSRCSRNQFHTYGAESIPDHQVESSLQNGFVNLLAARTSSARSLLFHSIHISHKR